MRSFFTFLILLFIGLPSFGSHLQGGEVKYAYLGTNPANGMHRYQVTFYIYNNCGFDSEIPLGRPTISVNIYNRDNNQRITGPDNTMQQAGLWLFQRGTNNIITTPLPAGCNIPSVSSICIRYIPYERIVELPFSIAGYYVIYDDYARTNTILNLQNPDQTGQSIYTEMTSPLKQNSSPVFSDQAVAVLCQGDTIQLSNNASDAEGDNLVYSFGFPQNDVLGATNSPVTWTAPVAVPYAPGYSFAQPFGAGGYAHINANTGVTKYFVPNPGDYVIAITVKEFRTNALGVQEEIGSTRRELMLFVRTCPPNTSPSFSSTTLNSLTANVTAGSQVCLPITATDPTSQVLTLTAPAGSVPLGATFAPTLPASGTGTLTNQFCWTTPCTASGMVQIPVRVTDSGCPPKFTEQVFTINISPTVTASFSGLEAGSYCLGSGSIAITGTPAGGVFSGPGISGSQFNPSVAGVGTHTINYTYTSPAGCISSSSQVVTVNTGPTVTISGLAPSYCLSSASVTLAGSPTGGTFSGPGVNGNIFTPSAAGAGNKTISYSVTSSNGCTSVQTLTTTVFSAPAVTSSPASSVCAGNSVTLQASGATTYTWTNSLNSGVQTGSQIVVSPGASVTYTVTGVIAAGCSAVAFTPITVNPAPAISAVATVNEICLGQSTQLTASGASTYSWQPGNQTGPVITVSPLNTTTYTVTGTNANGCVSTSTVQVVVKPLPTITTAGSQAICIGSSTTLTASGAVTYSWQPGNLAGNTITVSPSASTTYTVTGTGANGCTNTATRTVTVNSLPVISTSAAQAICLGNSATLSATGASTYTWQPGNLTGPSITVSPSATTSYTVTGTNAAGCINTAVTTITVNPLQTVAAIPNQAICSGGQATLTASGAVTYSWQPGNLTGSSVTVSPLATTLYTVTGTNANGCSNTATTQVTVNNLPVVSTTTSQTICPGGSAQLTASGAVSYTWQPGNLVGANITVSPSATTTYTVTGVNAAGCSNTALSTVTISPLPAVAAIAAQAICLGNSATLTATGAATYTWQPGNLTGQSITVSPSATTNYTVTGVNAAGCINTAVTTVIVNPLPAVAASAVQTVCSGTQVTLTASGATTYTWQPGNLTGQSITVTPTSSMLYTVTGVTTNGCSNTATAQVIVNSLPVISSSGTQNICPGGIATLTASGAVNYTWQPGNLTGNSISVSPVATTTYSVLGTGANGCSGTSQITVVVNPLPFINPSSFQTVCAGTQVTLTATGAATYTWQPGNLTGQSITVAPATTTVYSVTGTSAAGCVNTASTTVTVNLLPAITAIASQTICSGAQAILTATGAATYTWQPGNLIGSSVTVSPVSNTLYTVTGASANGCTQTATTQVNVSSLPVLTTSAPQVICPGGTATLTAAGATNYTWQPGNITGSSITVSPAVSTNYTVTGSGANGCNTTSIVSVTVSSLPVVNASTPQAICLGSSATLSATGASTYTWQPGNLTGPSITVSPSATTSYTVTGTNAAGCINTAVTTITVNPLPTVAVIPNQAICSGGQATLTASGAVTYTWQPGNLTGSSVTVSPLATTLYTVTGTNANGCSNTATTQVTVNNLPVVSTTTSQTICPGASAQLTASGAVSYTWQPGNLVGANITVSPSATTTYTVTGVNAAGCSNTALSTVTISPLPAVAAIAAQAICLGNSATLTATGAATYTWQPGNLTGQSITVSPSATTNYTVTGVNATGCINTAVTTVTVNPLPAVAASAVQTVCSGTQVTLTASGATTYTWQPGNLTGQSITVTPTSSTLYTVTGVTTNGCSNTATAQVIVNQLPVISISGNQSVCIGSAVTLSASGASNYTWLPGGDTGDILTVNLSSTTTYSVTGSDSNGCSATSTFTVTIHPLPTISINGASAICAGTSTMLMAGGASSYSWSPATGLSATTGSSVSASPVSSTTYLVNGTDANGCENTSSITINVNPLPVVSITSPQPICAGETVSLTATGTNIYLWQPGNLQGSIVPAQPQATALYTVTGTDQNGCSDTAMVQVIVHQLPSPVSVSGPATFCPDNTTGLTYTVPFVQGSSYSWSVAGGSVISGNGTSQIVVDLAGNEIAVLTVVETSAEGCQGLPNTLTITQDTARAEMHVVSVNPDNEEQILIEWEIPGQVTSNSIQLFRRVSGTQNWEMIATLAANANSYADTSQNPDSESFEYQVVTTNSCSDTLKTAAHRSILLAGTATESTSEAALTWNSYSGWPSGVRGYQIYRKLDNEPDFTLYQSTSDSAFVGALGADGFVQCFKIKAISNDNTRESWSNSICLTYKNPLLVPNIITPNGDGRNDVFVIDNIGIYKGAELVILNRWGKEIYRKTNYQNNWTPGSEIPDGTYFYQLVLANNTVLKGWLSITR